MKDQGAGRRANDTPLHPSDERALRESLDAILAKLGEHEVLLDNLKHGANEDRAAHPPPPSASHLRLAWSRSEPTAGALVSYADQAQFRAEQTTPPGWVPHPDHAESSFPSGPEKPPAIDEANLRPGRPIARPLVNSGRVKPKPRSARTLRRWMAATIAVFMSVATAAGIVLISGKTDREKLPGERISLKEFESRQRDAAAAEQARLAPAGDTATASSPSKLEGGVEDVAPIRQPMSRGDADDIGNIGVAGTPTKERSHDALGPQGEAERLSDKAPSVNGSGVSPKPEGKVVDQGAGFAPQPPVHGDGVSEAAPADALELPQPPTGNEAQTMTGAPSAPGVEVTIPVPPPARKPKTSVRPRKSEKEGSERGNNRSRNADVGQSSASQTRYVPVLILLKNPAAALQVYSQLRERHPALLGTKTAAVKSVTMDNNETWYRVVLNPAGTKDDAQSVCQQLGAEGVALGCSVRPQ